MDVLTAIRTRRAVRHYQDRPLPPAVVTDILNAGRLSQSAKNLQPWQFVAVQDRTRLRELAQAGKFSPHLGEAALGIVILTPPPESRFQILFDAGQAAAYMQLAGWHHGVGSCPVTSYNRDGVRALLGFPPDWHVRFALALGYPAPDAGARRGRRGGRRPLAEVVHWERWQA